MPIDLLPTQIAHVQRINTILETSKFALDLSSLGSGKTFASSYIATEDPDRFKHVIVIAPVSVKTKWLYMKKTHAVPVSVALSYCELRSVKHKQPKHGLLYRRDYVVMMQSGHTEVPVDKCAFVPTDKLKTMLDEGALLVIDEIQNIKNVSAQFLACQALIKAISELPENNTSRVLMLSGSPIDKMEQALHMFRVLNIMKREKVTSYNFQTSSMVWEGLQEIYDYCERVNQSALNYLVNQRGGFARVRASRDVATRRFVYDMFQQVMKPAMSSAMLPPVTGEVLSKRNGFYHVLDDDGATLLTNAVFNLGEVAQYMRRDIQGRDGLQSLRAISAALMQIETAKIQTFSRVARQALESDPQCKVALCVNYSATVADLVGALAEFTPLVLDGSTSVSQRVKVLERFQTPSTAHRLIIGNVSVMGTGIDLDDKHGAFPRVAFVSPNYSSINLYQLGFRFMRSDTKSGATVNFVYGAHAREDKILKVLATKSNVMKATTPEQAANGVVFASEHAVYEEPAPPNFVMRPVRGGAGAGAGAGADAPAGVVPMPSHEALLAAVGPRWQGDAGLQQLIRHFEELTQ